MNLRTSISALVFAALTLLAGCSKEPGIEPPEIMFGIDACGECRMIISEDRYACAVVMQDANSNYQTSSFDDIGCMLDFVAAEESSTAVALYVADYNSKLWLDATTASYLHSTELITPMAFGVAYFKTEKDAEELKITHPGDILDFESLKKRHADHGLSISSLGLGSNRKGDD